jgi:hypothetical protein
MKRQPYKKEKNLMSKVELVINPSIILKEELIDLMVKFKVKVQAFKHNDDVLNDLYNLMKEYFSDYVIDEILKSSFYIHEIRDFKIKKIIE